MNSFSLCLSYNTTILCSRGNDGMEVAHEKHLPKIISRNTSCHLTDCSGISLNVFSEWPKEIYIMVEFFIKIFIFKLVNFLLTGLAKTRNNSTIFKFYFITYIQYPNVCPGKFSASYSKNFC